MDTLIDQLLLCVRTEGIRSRPFATKIQPRLDMLRRVREMAKAKSIREVTPIKLSIDFLTGVAPQSAASSTLHVVSDHLERVYDSQDRRTKEALPVAACLSAQKARMETAGMPGTDWQVALEAKTCGCRIFLKVGCCIHLIYGLSVRNQLDLFGRARLAYRGRNRARHDKSQLQAAGRPANNRSALELV